MPRPKLEAEKQRKVIAVSLSPEALERIAQVQAEHVRKHGYRISRSQALELVIMQNTDQDGIKRRSVVAFKVP